jgi:hypothetical protein
MILLNVKISNYVSNSSHRMSCCQPESEYFENPTLEEIGTNNYHLSPLIEELHGLIQYPHWLWLVARELWIICRGTRVEIAAMELYDRVARFH